jgi:hypothetical protein
MSGEDDLWLTRFGAVIGRYLGSAGGMSPPAGAAEFTEPIDRAFLRSGTGQIEGMLWPAWQAVISAADTPDDAARSRLVELLSAIRDRGILVRPDGEECVVWDMRAHVDLPVFGAQMRETWNFPPPAVSAQSWANLNAFAAQLTLAGIDFSLYAIWALRDALEGESQEISLVLPAAVEWFRHAGPVLASLALGGHTDAHRADWVGNLGREAGLTDHGFTIRRWNFWKGRLEDIAAAGAETAPKAYEGLRYMHAAIADPD